jgi:aspartyl aminopeptidase
VGVEPAEDLLAFVDASPSPYHAVAEMAPRLEEAAYAVCLLTAALRARFEADG